MSTDYDETMSREDQELLRRHEDVERRESEIERQAEMLARGQSPYGPVTAQGPQIPESTTLDYLMNPWYIRKDLRKFRPSETSPHIALGNYTEKDERNLYICLKQMTILLQGLMPDCRQDWQFMVDSNNVESNLLVELTRGRQGFATKQLTTVTSVMESTEGQSSMRKRGLLARLRG